MELRQHTRVLFAIAVAIASTCCIACSHTTDTPGSIDNKQAASASATEEKPSVDPSKATDTSNTIDQASIDTVSRVIEASKAVAELCKENADDAKCNELIKTHLSNDAMTGYGLFTPLALGMQFDADKSLAVPADNSSGKRIHLKLFIPDSGNVGYDATVRVMGNDSIKVLEQRLTNAGQDYYSEHEEITGKWQS